MVRELKEVVPGHGSGGGFLLWGVVVTLSLILAVLFSCAGGASKDRTSASDAAYGAGCGADCGAACGA
ncbi:hypothetical protein AAC387_Pa02g0468 [Persea americana]